MSKPWALFMNTDDAPGFAVELCTEETFPETVTKAMFVGATTQEQCAEAFKVAKALVEYPDFDFEDGWLSLRQGVPAIVDFLMTKVKTLTADRDAESSERFEQMQRATAAEEKLAAIRATLRDLLTPQAEAITAAIS